jgi:hypothetical protein
MNKDVAKHALSETEQQVLQDFKLILTVHVSHFHAVIILNSWLGSALLSADNVKGKDNISGRKYSHLRDYDSCINEAWYNTANA